MTPAAPLLAPWPEQTGYGDAIENARVVAAVARLSVPGTTLGVRAALVRLFSVLGLPVVDQDAAELSSSSLTAALGPGTRLPRWEELPFPPPLFADPTCRLAPGAKMRVGLCWHGSGGGRSAPGADDDPRCIPVDALRPLLAVAGVSFIALQLGDTAPALRALPGGRAVPGLDTLGVRDFADTAGILQQLDLVVTIDTSVAHLAGNLGVRTWLLLVSPQHPNWDGGRWARTPPLYPDIRQVRQDEPGDWTSVIARVAAALCALTARVHTV